MTSNVKRKAHLRNVTSVNLPKRPCHQEKWKVEFNDKNEELVCDEEGNDPMVVSVIIVRFEVKRIFVDSGSTVEVLTWETYQKMGSKERALRRASPLYGFANHLI